MDRLVKAGVPLFAIQETDNFNVTIFCSEERILSRSDAVRQNAILEKC